MRPLLFLPEAKAELDEAERYYEARRPGLGFDLRREVELAANRIQENPERWSPFTERTRRFRLRRFPYSVIYLILPNHLYVIAVAHHKQRPGYWRTRL